jgi:Histidine kinase/Two component regulator propeller
MVIPVPKGKLNMRLTMLWLFFPSILLSQPSQSSISTSIKLDNFQSYYLDSQNTLWVGGNTGLLKLKKNVAETNTVQNGLPNDTITSICEDRSGNIWVGTQNGLISIQDTIVKDYGFKEGLLIKKITFLFHDSHNTLWVGTANGLYVYRGNRFVQSEILKEEKILHIFARSGQLHFVSQNGMVSILQPNNTNFIILSLIGLLIILLLIIYFFKRRISFRSRIQKELIQAEQQALLLQMSPHFIFNSLNSVQNYIANHQAEEANDYLSKFAKLMRRILEHARNTFITVYDEIQTLEMYLELESLRFEQKFKYKFIYEDSSFFTKEIPSMFIQPFVENAIWHGLLKKEGIGTIKIEIKKEDRFLIWKIQDDGIGRNKAQQIKDQSDTHKSRALDTINERIRLLNLKNKDKISLKVIDMENDSGTLVILKIPFSHEGTKGRK